MHIGTVRQVPGKERIFDCPVDIDVSPFPQKSFADIPRIAGVFMLKGNKHHLFGSDLLLTGQDPSCLVTNGAIHPLFCLFGGNLGSLDQPPFYHYGAYTLQFSFEYFEYRHFFFLLLTKNLDAFRDF